jgi:hypothetical protein
VSAIIGRAMNSIAVERRHAVPLLVAFVVGLRSHVPKAIDAMGDHIERRFAEFAGVPHPCPVCRQQWEELWEMEVERNAPDAAAEDESFMATALARGHAARTPVPFD